jgi:pyruvate kinase
VFDQARPGERVWLDDGKIGGVIVRVTSDEIDVRVTDVRPGGVNLKAGKGINFPDTDLRLDALTGKDLDDLDFVARHADMVNLSFVRHPADVEQLHTELERRDAGDVGIAFRLGVLYGLRRSEILALRWDDLDTKAGTLRIDESLVRPTRKTHPQHASSLHHLQIITTRVGRLVLPC